ncbi:MAG: HDOD domain-containing protein [Dehalococcoidia bacterium]|nr:HDOD domain-containing protein [Dehalococcoidia bacterium]
MRDRDRAEQSQPRLPGVWQFSLSTGLLAELLARVERQHSDHAFTAGVLHNIGLLALDQHLPDALTEAIDAAGRRGTSLARVERELLGFTDTDLGASLAARWHFPRPLVKATQGHSAPLTELPDRHSLTAFVIHARMFTRSYGLPTGLSLDRPALDEEEPPAASEWTPPPLSGVLQQQGGMEHMLERAQAFMRGAAIA